MVEKSKVCVLQRAPALDYSKDKDLKVTLKCTKQTQVTHGAKIGFSRLSDDFVKVKQKCLLGACPSFEGQCDCGILDDDFERFLSRPQRPWRVPSASSVSSN